MCGSGENCSLFIIKTPDENSPGVLIKAYLSEYFFLLKLLCVTDKDLL